MQVGTYFESWGMQTPKPVNDLINLQPGLNTVYLAFADPDLKYVKGQNTFQGTGLVFQPFSVIVNSISELQKRGVKVFLAVGGGSAWSSPKPFNAKSVVDLVNDLGCDGIDIDWEVGIQDDSAPSLAMQELRKLTSKLISFTCFGNGAQPASKDDKFRGMNLKAIRECSSIINQVNIMAYDAGKGFDSVASFKSFRKVYSGQINIGFEIGKQGWGDALLQKDELVSVCTEVRKDKFSGCFFWAYYSKPENSISREEAVKESSLIFNPPKPIYTCPSSVFIQCPSCKVLIKNSWSANV